MTTVGMPVDPGRLMAHMLAIGNITYQELVLMGWETSKIARIMACVRAFLVLWLRRVVALACRVLGALERRRKAK